MADPLFCYPVSVCCAIWPAESSRAAVAAAGSRGPAWPAAAGLAPSAGSGAQCTGLTGSLPTGHDRSMNGTSDQKQLVRPREGRMIAGVCAGIGQFFGIDANIVRIIFAVLTVFSAGAAALVYLVAWVVVPEEGEKGSIAENYLNKNKS
ncbi:MAG TPA: PspC domain-containing protein [Gemmataceae bacterium]|nr:PspC domain-containing protein [Gemmataceae bacterium]